MLQSLTSPIPKPKSEERCIGRGGRGRKNFFYNSSFLYGVYVVPFPSSSSVLHTHTPYLFAGQHEGPAPILKKDRGKKKQSATYVHLRIRREYLRTGKVIEGEYCIRRERKRKEDKTQTFYNRTRSPTPSCLVLKFPTSRPQHLQQKGRKRKKCPNTNGNKMRREREKKERKGKERKPLTKKTPKKFVPVMGKKERIA